MKSLRQKIKDLAIERWSLTKQRRDDESIAINGRKCAPHMWVMLDSYGSIVSEINGIPACVMIKDFYNDGYRWISGSITIEQIRAILSQHPQS